MPIGSYAELKDGELWLRALVGAPDGSQLVRGERRGPAEQAEALGISLAEELLDNGAREILAAVYDGEARDEHPGHSSTTARRSAGQPSAGHGTRGPELSADRIYARQGASRAGRCACRLGPDDLLFALSQHAVEFAHARLQQQGLPRPLLRAILPLAARRRWPCIRSVGSISITR